MKDEKFYTESVFDLKMLNDNLVKCPVYHNPLIITCGSEYVIIGDTRIDKDFYNQNKPAVKKYMEEREHKEKNRKNEL